jgi:hypothetical protein
MLCPRVYFKVTVSKQVLVVQMAANKTVKRNAIVLKLNTRSYSLFTRVQCRKIESVCDDVMNQHKICYGASLKRCSPTYHLFLAVMHYVTFNILVEVA